MHAQAGTSGQFVSLSSCGFAKAGLQAFIMAFGLISADPEHSL